MARPGGRRGDPSNLIRVMPAKGRTAKSLHPHARNVCTTRDTPMNVHDRDIVTPKVTTGPIAGSRKVHAVPEAAPDLRVPVREIMLTEAAGEPPVPVYDTSGPYTDNNVAIDVEAGLKRTRIEWVRERGDVEEYQGRPIQPVDNGNVTGKHLARAFPNAHQPLRALPGKPVTQYEWARAGVVTKEM